MLLNQINPFFYAEAIVIDAGLTISGSEVDKGLVLILAGHDAGNVYAITEKAGGFGSDTGVGVELFRIDLIGENSDNFEAELLEGGRNKVYGGAEITGQGFSIGGAFVWGNTETGSSIVGFGIQTSLGGSILGVIYAGYNKGEVNVIKLREDKVKVLRRLI